MRHVGFFVMETIGKNTFVISDIRKDLKLKDRIVFSEDLQGNRKAV